MGIQNCYTLEATFAGSSIGSKAGLHFHTRDYEGVGRALCLALEEWWGCKQEPGRMSKLNHEIEVKKNTDSKSY